MKRFCRTNTHTDRKEKECVSAFFFLLDGRKNAKQNAETKQKRELNEKERKIKKQSGERRWIEDLAASGVGGRGNRKAKQRNAIKARRFQCTALTIFLSHRALCYDRGSAIHVGDMKGQDK